MAPGGQREIYKLRMAPTHLVKEQVFGSTILEMFVTNMRYRPLTRPNMKSMRTTILSLYSELLNGSGKFPSVDTTGYIFNMHRYWSPFDNDQSDGKGTPVVIAAPGLLPPPKDVFLKTILTPVHPERMPITVLSADHRNCVRSMEHNGLTFNRVICPVFDSKGTVRRNRWRVTDYSKDGYTLMSVLCKFCATTASIAKTEGKTNKTKDKHHSRPQMPPKKRLRI